MAKRTSVGTVLWAAGLLVAAIAVPVSASPSQPADQPRRVDHDPVAKTVRMCGDAYCGRFDYDHAAVIGSFTLHDRELLAGGIYSSARTPDATITSLELPADPVVTVDGDQVTATFSTALADETWTFHAGAEQLDFAVRRDHRTATSLVEQGIPLISFAENAFDQMHWTADGGNFPLGGALANDYQPTWLATGKQFNGKVRVVKEQTSYTFLDRTTSSALRVDGTTNHDDLDRGRATEVWRAADKALNVGVLTSAQDLEYVNGKPYGYFGQSTRDGTPVFEPTATAAGQRDEVSLTFRPDAYDSYYDLGTLNGVDEDALSRAINDYARWMMQDTKKGASTEQTHLQSEVPPLEMHHIGEMLELFPEAGAISSFQHGLEDIRDYLVADSGRVGCCAPPGPGSWGVDYGDQASGYVLGVVKAYQLTGDKDWLAAMKDSADRSLDYMLENWTDPTTRFVRNVDPDLTETDYDNDYWESSTGEFNGYTSALLYDALRSWSRLERDVLGDDAGADRFESVAKTLKQHFNKDFADGGFWSPDSQTFLYGSENADALYLPINAQVLKTDLASTERKVAIANAIRTQNDIGNYDLHPMNVQDLYVPGKLAPTSGKGGENGGWYGAADGEFYAALPYLGDPALLQNATASFLTRYLADGFHGASTWDRDQPLEPTAAAVFFPTSVLPAWGLYHYGYGFQPADDRLVLEPFVSKGMSGSTVKYQWRGTPLEVAYHGPVAYDLISTTALPTPVTVHWINQRPGSTVTVEVDGQSEQVSVDADGTAAVDVPAGTTGTTSLGCVDCRTPGQADDTGDVDAVTSYDPANAQLRNDVYEQVGMQLSIGPRAVEISRLGRYKSEGNHRVHRVKLLDADGRIVASAPVDMSRPASDDGFVYANLTEPIRVEPGLYYLYTSETRGGDSWYDIGGELGTSANVSVLAGAYGRARTTIGGANTGYGPATFSYSTVGNRQPWLELLTTPALAKGSSGGEVEFELTVHGQADQPIEGSVDAALPDGWTADPVPFTIDTNGEPASTTVPVKVRIADDATTAVHQIDFEAVSSGADLRADRRVAVDVANLLYGFDDGTVQGWQGDSGVVGLAAVTRFANGPGVPYQGTHALQIDSGPVSAGESRTIRVRPSTPLDLSDARTVYAYVNSYGAIPGATKYQATLTIRSNDGEVSSTTAYTPNAWNRVEVDVSAWSGRSQVTELALTYQVHTDQTYQVYFDLDSVGFDT